MKTTKKDIRLSIYTFLIAFTVSLFLTSCGSDPSKKIKKENIESAKERINSDFNKTNHDFGEIVDGDIVETTFTFTNSGNSDLKILNASGSCGCTVPEYPRDTPIKPGESSFIKVKFDSSDKPGMQRKTVTLITNTSTVRSF